MKFESVSNVNLHQIESNMYLRRLAKRVGWLNIWLDVCFSQIVLTLNIFQSIFAAQVFPLNICPLNICHSNLPQNSVGWLNIWSDVRFAPNSVDTRVDFLVTVCLLGNVYPSLVYISSADTQRWRKKQHWGSKKEFDDQNRESKYLSIFQAMASSPTIRFHPNDCRINNIIHKNPGTEKIFGTIFGHWPNVRENHKHSKLLSECVFLIIQIFVGQCVFFWFMKTQIRNLCGSMHCVTFNSSVSWVRGGHVLGSCSGPGTTS